MDNLYTIAIGDFTVGETTYKDRCLSASFGGNGVQSEVIPWDGTENNPWDYKYEKGKFVLDIITMPEPEKTQTMEDRVDDLEAQLFYVSMMAGCLPEE